MEGSHLKAESILRQEGQESKMRIYLRVPDELRNEVCDTVQETGIKTISMEKKCKKAAQRNWGQEEKGTTEDEMAGWHHRIDGHEFE